MTNKMDRYDAIERQFKEEKDMGDKFNKMVEEVREYASALRLQKIRSPTAMAIDSTGQEDQRDWNQEE